MAIYRRGTIFWWKARVTYAVAGPHPTTLRMSLRTASPTQAWAWAHQLELARNAIREQLPVLRRTVKPEDLPKIFKRAVEREPDRTIVAQISEPGRVDDHRTFNAHYTRYFLLLAEKPHLLDGSTESFKDLRSLGSGPINRLMRQHLSALV